MSGPRTAAEIARWAEARSGASAAIARAEQWQIVTASKRSGMTLPRLAAEFGRSEVEVGRVLTEWTDTTDAAKHLLKARALELADRMMTEADPGIALEILERLSVVDAPSKSAGGITIQVGGDGSHVNIALLNQDASPALTSGDTDAQ